MYLLIAVMTFAAITFGATQNAERTRGIPANFYRLSGPQDVQLMPTQIIDPNPSAVRVGFYDPPLEFGTAVLGGDEYQTIRLSGEGSALEPGSPDLPRVSRLIMINGTGNVQLNITDQSYTIRESGLPLPVQIMEGDEAAPPDDYVRPLAEIYERDEWYPPQVAEISQPATLRDVRFVVLTIYPVQVNPSTGQMRVYDNVEVMIENLGGFGENEIPIQPRSITPGFKKLYRSFENFEGSALDELPVVPGRHLFVCDSSTNLLNHVRRLVKWRRQRGIDAYYATLSVIGGNNANSIRTYISNQYTASNGQLEFVSIVGDPDATSPYNVVTQGTQLDNYYGTMSGGPNPDPVPDVAVGRLCAKNDGQMNALVTKTVLYESDPLLTDTTWYTRAWCAAHTSYVPSNPSTKRYTQAIMLQHGMRQVDFDIFSSGISTQTLETRINNGVCVFNDRLSYIGQFSNWQLDGLANGRKNPFVMVVTCGTGTFDEYDGSDALSEEWVRRGSESVQVGAIGCVGLSGTGTHVPFNNIVDAGVMYGLYVQGIHEQGIAVIAGKLELYRNYWSLGGHSGDVQNFCYWTNLMGDPAVPIWLKTPRTNNVTRPATINLGTNNVTISATYNNGAPVANALVCLYKGTETFRQGYTNASGQANVPCSTATTGYMYLTITKDDFKSYVDSINVVSASVTLANYATTVDDDNTGGTSGDNNHTLNPGETIDLSIALANRGTSTTATGISATLTSSSPGIVITQASSAYPNIAPGANAAPSTPYRIAVTSVFNNDPVTFFLNVTSSAGAQVVRVDLFPAAGDVTYFSSSYYGPGGNLDPGESGDLEVTFTNSGARTILSGQGILRSRDAFIYVGDSVGAYGTVAAGTNGTNSTNRYNISISTGCYYGHLAAMQLVITDVNGFRDSTNFYLTIGTRASTSPTGPDGYGYYAYDNTEVSPANGAATYSWIELYPTPGTSLNFNDTAENTDASYTVALPFSFTFYGQSHSVITVCSNGWLAFGTNNQNDFRNYRMGSPLGPPNQAAPYWDDLKAWGTANNVYYWHDTENHLFVVEWRARTLWTNVDEIFEVILYDPAHYPSASGNGKIKFQYNTVNLSANGDDSNTDNLYSSVGIQNADHSIGLDYYYWNVHATGSATLAAGRAIMFTTDGSGQLNPRITLIQPDGGETWYVGQPYNILWQTTAITGNVNVALNRTYPSAGWTTILSDVANDGVEAWTVTAPVSATARVRITSVNIPSVGDTSNASFSIVMPSASMVYPNGGEVLAPGTVIEVAWTSVGLGACRVDLNRDYPSVSWEALSPSAGDAYEWTVTGPPTNTARVRVIGLSVPTVGDTSAANFIIGSPPTIAHDPHADIAVGTARFTAIVSDDGPGFTTKLFYRVVGAGTYDSLTLSSTGYPNEYSVTTASLSANRYEYYLRATDLQLFSASFPIVGTLRFDVGALTPAWIAFDDSVAENYNYVQGPDFKWAVKFDPGAYPYALAAGRFAVSATRPQSQHYPIVFRVYNANGPGGLPGTLLFTDTTGAPGNVIGGLPGGPAWAEAVTRVGGQMLQLSGPFYLSVENIFPIINASAFATDTSATRTNRSYLYDGCLAQWFNENDATPNARRGDRMIRANGFPLLPPTVVVIRSGSDVQVKWYSNGAPYYRVYSANNPTGPFSTYEGNVAGNSVGVLTTFVDVNAVNLSTKLFYQVVAAETPGP